MEYLQVQLCTMRPLLPRPWTPNTWLRRWQVVDNLSDMHLDMLVLGQLSSPATNGARHQEELPSKNGNIDDLLPLSVRLLYLLYYHLILSNRERILPIPIFSPPPPAAASYSKT
jgi:hypothetical protein